MSPALQHALWPGGAMFVFAAIGMFVFSRPTPQWAKRDLKMGRAWEKARRQSRWVGPILLVGSAAIAIGEWLWYR